MAVKVSSASAELIRGSIGTTGALAMGRGHFDHAGGWGGGHPMDLPTFVVTHAVPRQWVHEGSPFVFVTDDVESAIEQARVAAGDKNVGVGGVNVARQCIKAGLVDEIGIDLVPVLLVEGIRSFDYLDTEPIELERTRVIEGSGVTRLRFRVVK